MSTPILLLSVVYRIIFSTGLGGHSCKEENEPTIKISNKKNSNGKNKVKKSSCLGNNINKKASK